jgi:hypothetical protein
MTSIQRIDSRAFEGLLTEDFINGCVPEETDLDPTVELIKDKASRLALSLFNPGKRDLHFDDKNTFGQLFSQERYGDGFPTILSKIMAYAICLEEYSEEDLVAVENFAERVQEVAGGVFAKLSRGDPNLSYLKDVVEKIDNYGGFYTITRLSDITARWVIPNGEQRSVPSAIDPVSKNLVAVFPDFCQRLLDHYRSEIESYLTEEGRASLRLPNETTSVVIAYKNELARMPKTVVEQLLEKKIDLIFSLQALAIRRDNPHYSAVAYMFIKSSDFITLRTEFGLNPIYTPFTPLRLIFGAVHKNYSTYDEQTILSRMRQSVSLLPLMTFVEGQIQIKV